MGEFSPKKFKQKEKQNAARAKRNAEKASSSFTRRLPTVPGGNLLRFKETNTKGDYPWVEMGIHYNCGPSGDLHIRCLRDNVEEGSSGFQPASACPQCSGNKKDVANKDNPRAKVRALKRRRVQRTFLEGLCLTPLLKFFLHTLHIL